MTQEEMDRFRNFIKAALMGYDGPDALSVENAAMEDNENSVYVTIDGCDIAVVIEPM